MKKDKYQEFISDLRELCIKHNVMICSSMYDFPAVYDLVSNDDLDDSLTLIEDHTENGKYLVKD